MKYVSAALSLPSWKKITVVVVVDVNIVSAVVVVVDFDIVNAVVGVVVVTVVVLKFR